MPLPRPSSFTVIEVLSDNYGQLHVWADFTTFRQHFLFPKAIAGLVDEQTLAAAISQHLDRWEAFGIDWATGIIPDSPDQAGYRLKASDPVKAREHPRRTPAMQNLKKTLSLKENL